MGSSLSLTTAPGTCVLFLDLQELGELTNVERVVDQARKHPSPLLPLGPRGTWDSLVAFTYGTVFYDEDERIYKMWYTGRDLDRSTPWRVGYAISHDGLFWTKPALGLYAYNGRVDNNIVFPDMENAAIIKDKQEDDPAKLYKCMGARGYGAHLYYSPDGLHWAACAANPVIDRGPAGTYDSHIFEPHSLLRDDADPNPAYRYKVYGQSIGDPTPEEAAIPKPFYRIRRAVLAYSADGEHWTKAPSNPILRPEDGPEEQIHMFAVSLYRGYYIGLYEYAWTLPWTGLFACDIRLAVSRDGFSWTRINPHQKVIPLGEPGAWDSGMVMTSNNIVVRGDEIRLYYGGNDTDYNYLDKPCRDFPRRSGVAFLRKDGFTHLQLVDDEIPGSVTTIPVAVTHREGIHLEINATDLYPPRSWIEVEVLDAATNRPLPGYERVSCDRFPPDGTGMPVRWGGSTSWQGVTSTSVRLRFHLFGRAKLYSFAFERDEGV